MRKNRCLECILSLMLLQTTPCSQNDVTSSKIIIFYTAPLSADDSDESVILIYVELHMVTQSILIFKSSELMIGGTNE